MVKQHDVVGVGAFLLVYGHLLRGIELGRLYAFGDFPPYYGGRAIGKFAGIWHEWQLGYSFVHNTVPAYLGVVTGLGGPLAQNGFFLALLPLGFLTFRTFARRFIDDPAVLYLASGLYALNPVTISEFVNGGVAPLIGFAGFPLVVHYLYEVHERGAWSDALKAGLVFGATNVTVWLTFWMILPFSLAFGWRHRYDPGRLSRFAGAGGLGVLLSLPNFHHVLQRAGGLESGRAALLDALIWNYGHVDVLSVLRLAGNRTRATTALGYNTDPMMAIGLVIPLMAALTWDRRDLRLYHGVVVAVAGFLVATSAGLTVGLFDLFPPLWSLRNPIKLQYPHLLSLALLFGCGVQRVHRSRLTEADIAMTGLLVLALFTYVVPAQGALGLEATRGDDYYVSEDERAVLERVEGPVLWVPYGYVTQLHLRDAEPDHVGIKSGGTLHGIQNTAYVTRLFQDVAAGRPVGARLAQLGVRYVVVSKHPPEPYGAGPPRTVRKWGAPWLWGDPAAYQRRFASSPNFEAAFEGPDYVVFELATPGPSGRVQTYQGLHTLRYPDEASVERQGPNRLDNPSFANGTRGWWLPPETGSRTVDHDAGQVEVVTGAGAKPLPVAQEVELRPRHPFEVSVDAEGGAEVHLFWYEDSKAEANLVGHRVVTLNQTPVRFTAKADLLSLRIKPTGRTMVVREVALYRTTYPPSTAPGENAQEIPGAVVHEGLPDATVVASNLPDREADVRVTDAETVLEGELVFDERYRQGVAVRPAHDPGREIPDDAAVVTDDDGGVIDYWVTGEFDRTNVTVVRSSYDERWWGPPGSTHFRAFGWANGFTNASPAEIEPPSNRLRAAVVDVWTLSWMLALTALAGLELLRWQRKRREGHDGLEAQQGIL